MILGTSTPEPSFRALSFLEGLMPSDFFKCYKSFWTGSMRTEPPHTRLVFLSLLSLADEFGRVEGSVHFIADFSALPFPDVAEAMRLFHFSITYLTALFVLMAVDVLVRFR